MNPERIPDKDYLKLIKIMAKIWLDLNLYTMASKEADISAIRGYLLSEKFYPPYIHNDLTLRKTITIDKCRKNIEIGIQHEKYMYFCIYFYYQDICVAFTRISYEHQDLNFRLKVFLNSQDVFCANEKIKKIVINNSDKVFYSNDNQIIQIDFNEKDEVELKDFLQYIVDL